MENVSERRSMKFNCKSYKIEAANDIERLASRIKVRERTSPPESGKRKASNQEENLETLPRYLKDA